MTSEASVPSLYFVLSTASTQLNHNLTVGSNQTFWSPAPAAASHVDVVDVVVVVLRSRPFELVDQY